MITPATFKKNPNRAICSIFNFPEENTIAFGGVPTGNMKAQLEANVIGRQN